MEISVDSMKAHKNEILSVVALIGVVALAVTGSIAGEAAVTFIGGLVMSNPAGVLRQD